MIFVSHAREDAAFALALARALQAEGHAVLIDPPLLQGDAFWRQRLARQLAGCDTMVTVESPAAAASPWVQQERLGFRGARRSVAAASAVDVGEQASQQPSVRATEPRAQQATDANAEPTECPGDRHTAQPAGRPTAWAAERLALAARQQAWLHAVLAAPAPRAEFAGDRAWLAGGRIELRRVPGGTYVATTALPNSLYREFVAALGGEVPPPPTWTDPEFAAAFAGDGLPATAMTWFEAAACAHHFGATLPSTTERASLTTGAASTSTSTSTAAAASWDWCRDRWRPDDASALAHRVIFGELAVRGTFGIGAAGALDSAATGAIAPSALRYRNAPIDRDCSVGLRLALPPPAHPRPSPAR